MNNIKAVLCDLDGVLYIDDILLNGAVEAVEKLLMSEKNVLFCTNTTKNSLSGLMKKMQKLNLPITEDLIFTPPKAAIKWLSEKGQPKIYPLINDELKEEFKDFDFEFVKPEYIVIGDIGRVWSYDLMNELFNLVMGGAEILALHKGKFWQATEGLRIDIGAFVAGLEYTTGKKSHIFGKPSAEYFLTACKMLGEKPENVVMAGDDIITDIGGAMEIGIKGAIIKTGKYREDFAVKTGIEPDFEFNSIKDFTNLI